jgi:hypothetical protein
MRKKTTIFFAFSLLLYPYLAGAVDKGSVVSGNEKSVANKIVAEDDFFIGYLNLAGTVLVSEKDRKLNKAVFQDVFTKKRVTYREGSLLPFGIKLKKVEKDGVILAKGELERTLALGDRNNYFREIKALRRSGYRQIAPNEWVVNSHYLFKGSEDLINIAVDSGLTLKGSKINPGIKIAGDTNKKMAGLGFKKGDKVIDINGASLDGLMGVASAYRKMRKSDNITIKVLRDGKPVELNYWVAKRGAPRYNMQEVLASGKIKKMLSM